MLTRRDALKTFSLAALAPSPSAIEHIDIYHHSHTDVGYTDIPSVTRDLQVRFLDAALDACLHHPTFRWTAECTLTVDDWWRQSTAARHRELIQMVEAGRMDVMALPFNQAPFMDALEWREAMNWLPALVRRELRLDTAMQNDVNGFPRAGAIALLNRNIHHLLMGINTDMGGPPFRRPSAFFWQMPDKRKIFVWLGHHYGTAYSFFEAKRWQHGQPKGGTLTLRPPYAGDFLHTDEASLRTCHAYLLTRLAELKAEGYTYPRLILSYTNQWRWDNDAPFPPLADFVDAWTRLGLQPTLRLTTASRAVRDMEQAVASVVPTYSGEWTDWWANGDASGPREVAASRRAKRFISAAVSPVWGPLTVPIEQKVSEMLRDLCLFDEHTWGANISVSEPYALDTLAQYTEKSLLAYRPMGHAEHLLGQRGRVIFASRPEGEFVVNTAPEPFTGWLKFPGIDRKPEWISQLAPRSIATLKPAPVSTAKPDVRLDDAGWPVAAQWPGMRQSLFGAGLGDMLSVYIKPPNKRSSRMFPERLARIAAAYGASTLEETPHTLVYTQPILHPSLNRATRRLELFRDEPRATLTVRFDRKPDRPPEALYALTPVPAAGVLPLFSNGGVEFTPFTDQLPGSCRDYFTIDAWAAYTTSAGRWLVVTRDAPLVSVGGPHTWQRITAPPADPEHLWTLLFDNFWHTNFVADQNGAMEFQFELAWSPTPRAAAPWAETLLSEPVAVYNPALKPTPELYDRIFVP